MALTQKSPEQLKVDRLAREERAAKDAQDSRSRERGQAAYFLLGAGTVLLLLAVYFLWLAPTIGGIATDETTVNLQRLFIGSTCGVAGAVFVAAGLVLRYVG